MRDVIVINDTEAVTMDTVDDAADVPTNNRSLISVVALLTAATTRRRVLSLDIDLER